MERVVGRMGYGLLDPKQFGRLLMEICLVEILVEQSEWSKKRRFEVLLVDESGSRTETFPSPYRKSFLGQANGVAWRLCTTENGMELRASVPDRPDSFLKVTLIEGRPEGYDLPYHLQLTGQWAVCPVSVKM